MWESRRRSLRSRAGVQRLLGVRLRPGAGCHGVRAQRSRPAGSLPTRASMRSQSTTCRPRRSSRSSGRASCTHSTSCGERSAPSQRCTWATARSPRRRRDARARLGRSRLPPPASAARWSAVTSIITRCAACPATAPTGIVLLLSCGRLIAAPGGWATIQLLRLLQPGRPPVYRPSEGPLVARPAHRSRNSEGDSEAPSPQHHLARTWQGGQARQTLRRHGHRRGAGRGSRLGSVAFSLALNESSTMRRNSLVPGRSLPWPRTAAPSPVQPRTPSQRHWRSCSHSTGTSASVYSDTATSSPLLRWLRP